MLDKELPNNVYLREMSRVACSLFSDPCGMEISTAHDGQEETQGVRDSD